jgi:hypothetical protein
MQEQEFLVLHPCKTGDSCETWSLKSHKKYHYKTCKTLLPPNLTGPKGGLRPSKRGGKPSFWVPAASYRNNTLFLLCTDSTYLCTYTVLHFSQDQGCKTRPRSCKKSHVLVLQGLTARPNSTKFTVRDVNQLIDVSSAACDPSSTIPIGSTQHYFPALCTRLIQFYSITLIKNFDIDDAEAKLFALMKSCHAIDGCKLVQHQVDKAITCNHKRNWTFICSHGKVMRNIDEKHFGPDSAGKINIAYQNAKRTKSKGSIKDEFVLCIDIYMNSFIH